MKINAFKPGMPYLWIPPKLLFIMKLITFIIFAAIMQVSAAGFSQINLNEKNAPLTRVLESIKKQTGYVFLSKDYNLNHTRIDVDLKNASIEEALNACFKNLPLAYKINDRTVFIQKKIPSFLDKVSDVIQNLSKNIDVHGRVVGDQNIPLAGATVTVKGTNRKVITNASGEFVLNNVDEKAFLLISYLGYASKEIKVSSDLGNITLEVESSKLNEVNVVSNGYQTISKERSAGSFAKPDMTIINNRSTSMNILQRLDGLVPGLTVNNAPGQSQYLIRGATTVSINTAPLFVVDGTPIADISYVNPQDIADITVLKDAMSASIWGARAANGVIVINTKKGIKGDKVKVTYDAFVNFQGKPDINYFPVLNNQQFIQAAKEIFDPVANPYASVSTNALPPHSVILYNQYLGKISDVQANKSLDSLASINNNSQIKDLFYRNAMLMNHTVSVSGGQKSYSFYGSAAYTDTYTSSPGQSNNTYKINIRQDFNIGTRIKLNLITDLTQNATNSPRNLNPTDQFFPYQLFQDNAGKNISMPYMQTQLSDVNRIDYQTRSRISLDYNPLDDINTGYTKTNMLLSRNILGASIKIIDGLNFEGNYGFIKSNTRTPSFDSAESYLVRAQRVQFTVAPTDASTPVYYLPGTGGNYSLTNLEQQNWTIRNQLDYNKDWKNGLHQLTILAGQEVQEQNSINDITSTIGWDPQLQTSPLIDYKTLSTGLNGVVWPNSGSTSSSLNVTPFREAQTISRFVSYYSNAAYTYNHKYTVNGSFRVDQSNNFGLDKSAQNKPVWSAGGKWLISDESFMRSLLWVNNLALRATYGLTGNAPMPGTAASYDIISSANSTFLPNGLGLQIATPANRKLTWESTATINLGIDYAVLNNRLYGTLDVYRKKTTNLLGNLNTDIFTGYPAILGNLGDLENKGIELGLTSINIRGEKFSWSTTLNGAYNKNVITRLNISTPVTTGSGLVNTHFIAGHSAYAIFAYQYAGLDNLGDPQIRLADGTVTKALNASKPGDIKYMGTTSPPWSGGLSNNFSYKSFGLSFNAVFNLGAVMRRDVNQFYRGQFQLLPPSIGGFASGNVNAEFANRWKQPGDELTTNIPSYVANQTTSNARRDYTYYTNADINVVSASFVKMRDITLTYSLPRFMAKKIAADQVTFRAQVSNLMIWKANKYGIDPEFQSDYLGTRTLPLNQGTVSLGLNVRF